MNFQLRQNDSKGWNYPLERFFIFLNISKIAWEMIKNILYKIFIVKTAVFNYVNTILKK